MLSGRGLCDELITRPEESYRRCCVVVCDLETPRMGAPYIYIYDISRLRVNLDINLLKCNLNTKRKRQTDDSTSLAYDDVSLGSRNPTNAGEVISRAAGLRRLVGS